MPQVSEGGQPPNYGHLTASFQASWEKYEFQTCHLSLILLNVTNTFAKCVLFSHPTSLPQPPHLSHVSHALNRLPHLLTLGTIPTCASIRGSLSSKTSEPNSKNSMMNKMRSSTPNSKGTMAPWDHLRLKLTWAPSNPRNERGTVTTVRPKQACGTSGKVRSP